MVPLWVLWLSRVQVGKPRFSQRPGGSVLQPNPPPSPEYRWQGRMRLEMSLCTQLAFFSSLPNFGVCFPSLPPFLRARLEV